MSDTPRTDDCILVSQLGSGPFVSTKVNGYQVVRADFARQLERELNTAKAQAAQMREALEHALRLRRALCFNNCEVCAPEWACHDEYAKQFSAALSSDAGKDYVHKSEVEKAYREGYTAGSEAVCPTETFREDYRHSRARRVVEGKEV